MLACRALSPSPASGRSHSSYSNREALRQFKSSTSAAMGRLGVEPGLLEAHAQHDARAVQDHPAIGGRDALVAADDVGLLAEHLALEEDAAPGGGQATEAALEHFPESPLLERGLRIVPRLRRRAPMPGLVEHLVQP